MNLKACLPTTYRKLIQTACVISKERKWVGGIIVVHQNRRGPRPLIVFWPSLVAST